MEQYGRAFDGYKSAERERIERQIATIGKKIDEVVYQLYGLNQEEIKVVENV